MKYPIEVVNIPLTRIVPVDHIPILRKDSYDGVVFMSTEGVNSFMEYYGISFLDGKKVFSIGEKTSKELMYYGISSKTPTVHDSEGLFNLIKESMDRGDRILIPRNLEHKEDLEKRLLSHNIECVNLILYHYEELSPVGEIETSITGKDLLGLVFTSPLEVEIFQRLTQGRYTSVPCFPVGKTTKSALQSMGYNTIPLTGNGNFEELIMKIGKNSGEWI
ncbi:uroporphyrinogen-III synthase [Cuniculiplasma sp. SKW4]|uniref:uroporphyrinogen-III synthase n=1 Tax=Cuniculiplasma sp. SKW4 TaxID=3400171 RepID=UPI003FD65091